MSTPTEKLRTEMLRVEVELLEKRLAAAEQENAALRRELEAARGTWQPISTAPKDGADFLALIPFKKKHHQIVGCFAPNGMFVSWPGRWNYEPTHWMPLPAQQAQGRAENINQTKNAAQGEL